MCKTRISKLIRLNSQSAKGHETVKCRPKLTEKRSIKNSLGELLKLPARLYEL